MIRLKWVNIWSLLKDYKVTLGIAIAFVSLYLAPGRSVRSPFASIPSSDKVLHAILFGGLALLIYSEYYYKYRHRWRRDRLWKPLACILLLSILLEFIQGVVVPQRSGDIYDLTANTIGIVCSTLGIYLFAELRQKRNN